MNTISTTQNTVDLYSQSTGQVTKATGESKVHHHHKEQTQDDSIAISEQGLQTVGNTAQGTTNTNNPLDTLVSAGTITQDQANAIQSAFQAGGKSIQSSGTYNNKPKSPLDSLVSSGVITKTQESAVRTAFQTAMKANHPTSDGSTTTVTNPLDSLVAAGTITQDQENSIENAFQAAM